MTIRIAWIETVAGLVRSPSGGVDGRIGPETLGAVESVFSAEKSEALLIGVQCEAAGFYRGLVAKRSELKKFLRRWLRRAYDAASL